jgi:hypothetical protein
MGRYPGFRLRHHPGLYSSRPLRGLSYMNQDNPDLWHTFELTALDLWRSGGESPNRVHGKIEDVFAIRRIPSFANPVHWQVYRRIEESADLALYVGVRREWNADADRRQFAEALALVRYK